MTLRLKNKKAIIERFYASLYLIRRVEEEIARIYPSDKIKSPVHLSIGQEAVSVAVIEALSRQDVVFGTYRGHAMYLAKGGNLDRMFAELYGKVTGCCRGKGGSMHLADVNAGVMGTSAIVATTIPLSVGFAYGLKYRNKKSVVASFFGDGAVDEGAFHESLNFAALKKLPVIFICENNCYAIHSHHLCRHHSGDISRWARAYGMPVYTFSDQDIFTIYGTVADSIRKIRSGSGPVFFECHTSRWREHVGPSDDFHLGYRQPQEVEQWKKKDQLARLSKLIDKGILRKIQVKAEKQIRQAIAFAEKGAFPAAGQLYSDVLKDQACKEY